VCVFPVEAAHLCIKYPQDPEAPEDEQDALLARQFDALAGALTDTAPAVRSAAATGVCHVLNTYWEVVPARISAVLIKRLTGVAQHRALVSGTCGTVQCQGLKLWGVPDCAAGPSCMLRYISLWKSLQISLRSS
jgi:hypothetical protein